MGKCVGVDEFDFHAYIRKKKNIGKRNEKKVSSLDPSLSLDDDIPLTGGGVGIV